MAGVLKEEKWPNPRETEVMKSGRKERERFIKGVKTYSVHWREC